MRYTLILLLLGLTYSCTTNTEKSTERTTANDSIQNNSPEPNSNRKTKSSKNYTEFHPSGQVSIEGDLDPETQLREGLWVAYYENGIKWSEANYVNGKRNGHSITFYPNGKVRYFGEFKNDQKVGEWVFYGEDGKVQKEENYD